MGLMTSDNSTTWTLSTKVLKHSQSSTSVEPQTQKHSSTTCLKKRQEDRDDIFPENRWRWPFLRKMPMADGIYAIALATPAKRNTTQFKKKKTTNKISFFLSISKKLSQVSKIKKLI